jgi:hypothetical protein
MVAAEKSRYDGRAASQSVQMKRQGTFRAAKHSCTGIGGGEQSGTQGWREILNRDDSY